MKIEWSAIEFTEKKLLYPDFLHDPLQRVVGAQVPPMRLGKGIIAERLMGTLTNDLRRGMKLPVRELGHDDFDLVLRRLAVFLGVNGLEHHRHFGQAVVGHHAEHIAIEVDYNGRGF